MHWKNPLRVARFLAKLVPVENSTCIRARELPTPARATTGELLMSDERNPSLDTLSVPNLLRQLADAMEKENSFAVLLGPQPDERSSEGSSPREKGSTRFCWR